MPFLLLALAEFDEDMNAQGLSKPHDVLTNETGSSLQPQQQQQQQPEPHQSDHMKTSLTGQGQGQGQGRGASTSSTNKQGLTSAGRASSKSSTGLEYYGALHPPNLIAGSAGWPLCASWMQFAVHVGSLLPQDYHSNSVHGGTMNDSEHDNDNITVSSLPPEKPIQEVLKSPVIGAHSNTSAMVRDRLRAPHYYYNAPFSFLVPLSSSMSSHS